MSQFELSGEAYPHLETSPNVVPPQKPLGWFELSEEVDKIFRPQGTPLQNRVPVQEHIFNGYTSPEDRSNS